MEALYDGALPVAGIFEPASRFDIPDGFGLEEARPSFLCPRGALPGDPHRKTLAIGAETYVIAAIETDGAGVARLTLVQTP